MSLNKKLFPVLVNIYLHVLKCFVSYIEVLLLSLNYFMVYTNKVYTAVR